MTIDEAKNEARRKAFNSLAKYKFMMFGYHAALWVTLNNLSSNKERNPFSALVELAGNTFTTDEEGVVRTKTGAIVNGVHKVLS